MKIEPYLYSTLLNLLKKKNIDEIRVTEIIGEIGICKGTFYKYCQDKYDLLCKCFDKYYYNEIINNAETLQDYFAKAIDMFAEIPRDVVLNAFTSNDVNTLKKHNVNIIKDIIRRQYVSNVSNGSIVSQVVCQQFATSVTDALLYWVENEYPISRETLLEAFNLLMPKLFA